MAIEYSTSEVAHRPVSGQGRRQWVPLAISDLVYSNGMARTIDPCHNRYMAMHRPGLTEDSGSLRTDYILMACLGPSTHVINQCMATYQRRPWVDKGQWVTLDSSYSDGMPRTVDPCHKSIHGYIPASTLGRQRTVGHLGLIISSLYASNHRPMP
jgi:hypothetical protein